LGKPSWSWANDSLPPQARTLASQVKALHDITGCKQWGDIVKANDIRAE
jgi:hypothetical protein